jgi:drug/metabolite transporter (DMT)-like permease
MQELTFSTLIAVAEEVFGRGLFWALVAAALVGLLAFAAILVRDRGLRTGPFVWAEIVGIFGGIAAILFVQAMTRSGFTDIGGPIDWVALLAIWLAGAIGTTLIAYVALRLMRGRPAA